MKQMIPTYTFNAAAKTITLSGFTTVRLDRLLLIVNVTRNVIYYNFADSTLGATVATNVITLTNASTSGHADADKLEIFYDTVSGDPDYLTAQPVTDNSGSLTVDSSVKNLYGTEAQALTITLTSLASSATAGRESTAVVNTSNLHQDILVMAQVKIDSGTIGNDKRVYVWAYGTVDGTTPVYPDTVTGSDAAITMNSPTNLRLLGIIECPAQSTTYKSGPWSLRDLFGSIPQKWGVVVQNYTNIALTAVAGDHKVIWQAVDRKLV